MYAYVNMSGRTNEDWVNDFSVHLTANNILIVKLGTCDRKEYYKERFRYEEQCLSWAETCVKKRVKSACSSVEININNFDESDG